jgi:hypothetical protein
MKNLLIIILFKVISTIVCSAKPSAQPDFNEIRSEIEWFIRKTKPEAIQGGKYDVYLVKMYGDDEGRLCVTIGILRDSLYVEGIRGFDYFMRLNGELILFNFPEDQKSNFSIKDSGIALLTDSKIIADKIYPGVVFIGTTARYVCCFDLSHVMKMYYDDSDPIPYDKKIFKYTPQGQTIKMDSSEMRRKFRSNGKKN